MVAASMTRIAIECPITPPQKTRRQMGRRHDEQTHQQRHVLQSHDRARGKSHNQ
jgi:hypothetical protein